MQITYELTAEDYRQAILASRNRTNSQRWRSRIGGVIVYAWLAFILLMVFIGRTGRLRNVVAFLILAAFWGTVRWYAPYRFGKKMMKGSPIAQAIHTVEISDTGLQSHTPFANSSILWESVVDWIEAKTVFVLFLSSVSCFPLPKRAMTEGQPEEFRALLATKVGKH